MIALTSAGEARAVVIALDTCVGKCTEEDQRLVRAFRQVLASTTQVTATPSDVMQAISDGMPRSALLTPSMTARALADGLKLGIDHWVGGRYAEAENQLADALISVRVNPVLVTSDPILRQLIPRAYVARAVSLWRLGHRTTAQGVIAELVRTMPEQSILDTWGSEADKIFQLARKELEALGKGSLVVEIDDPNTIFYVNEAGQPQRMMFTGMLYPGPYRILVQDANGRNRLFHIKVEPNSTSMLRIRWQRDLQFSTSGEHIGFVFESAADRVHEGEYARHVASLAKATHAVVFGRVRWRNGPALIATIYRASDSSVVRAGVVSLQRDEDSALRQLADFLSSQLANTPRVTRLAAPPWDPAGTIDHGLGLRYPLGWGLGAVALTAGVALRVTADDSARRTHAGYALIGAGLAAGLATTVLYLRRSNDAPQSITAAVVPMRSGLLVTLGGSF
jgi:hypothetical protein